MIRVTLDVDADPSPMLMLQAETWEVHIRASLADLSRLTSIRRANWDERRSLQVGECAGAPVFWAVAGDDHATILIGQDDETWDAALIVPLATIDEIVTLTRP
ncbi:hypothetical protein [Actinomadura montaniterrae]|uniref:Uncharacterized protein n=1 Tax=Actinomadura montaniterrae TaxID=1803903 RepID=A0A6L3VS54_9ACTN|nr:hypothetical protein [Actinomadura montaniterrae]KAB2376427.1 hypothetical protein F9B16_25165 [Actinomadura montaniterrae]